MDGKASLGTKCRLVASGPAVHKIPEDKHRKTSSFEKTKYSQFQDAEILFFVSHRMNQKTALQIGFT